MLPVLAENLTLIAIWNLQGSAVSNLTTEIHSLYISLWATAADTFSSFQKMMRKCAICFIFYYILKLNLTQCWSHYSFWKRMKLGTLYPIVPNGLCVFSWDSRFKQLLNFRAYTEIKCTTLVTVAFFWI